PHLHPHSFPTRRSSDLNARAIWERLGLPPLKPETPWHGYDLGVWPRNLERQAAMATRSEYFDFSAELIAQRRADVAMNEPVPHRSEEHTSELQSRSDLV